jgi:N-acetylglucosamine-6-sulfatase
MKHPNYPAIAATGLLLSSCGADQTLRLERLDDVRPRNVIFILSDDHRHDFFGFTGKVPWLQTPHLDELALNGAHLQNAFCTSSLSSPSRASILTGLYAHQHEVVDNYEPVRQDLIFFPQYLQKEGYQTAFFGKWHMGHETDEPQRGFSHWESFMGQGVYYNPTLNINGERISYGDSTYISDLLTQHTIDWLKKRDQKKPFFVYLSHKAVHHEWIAAKKHKGMYDKELIPSAETLYQYVSGRQEDPQRHVKKHGKEYYRRSGYPRLGEKSRLQLAWCFA